MLQTGYFADTKTWTKVHVVKGNTPICGAKVSEKKEFQWCSNGIMIRYIECDKCKGKAEAEIYSQRVSKMGNKEIQEEHFTKRILAERNSGDKKYSLLVAISLGELKKRKLNPL